MAPGTIDADNTIRDERDMVVTTLIRVLAAAGNVHTVKASLEHARDITERLITADRDRARTV